MIDHNRKMDSDSTWHRWQILAVGCLFLFAGVAIYFATAGLPEQCRVVRVDEIEIVDPSERDGPKMVQLDLRHLPKGECLSIRP
jgi:hypothetical protein